MFRVHPFADGYKDLSSSAHRKGFVNVSLRGAFSPLEEGPVMAALVLDWRRIALRGAAAGCLGGVILGLLLLAAGSGRQVDERWAQDWADASDRVARAAGPSTSR